MIEDLNAQIENLNAELEATKENYKLRVQEIIKQLFGSFLKKYEGIVEYVHWKQCTPGWNDGEATYFRLEELYLKLTFDDDPDEEELSMLGCAEEIKEKEKVIAQWHEYNNNKQVAINKYGYGSSGWKPSYYSLDECEEQLFKFKKQLELAPTLSDDFSKLSASFAIIDDEIMQATFGDPAKVQVELKNGVAQFTIEGYECYD